MPKLVRIQAQAPIPKEVSMARQHNESRIDDLALAIARGTSVTAWAAANGISRNTAYSWTLLDGFKAKVSAYRTKLVDESVGLLTGSLRQAVDQLVSLMKTAESEQVKLAACRLFLDQV